MKLTVRKILSTEDDEVLLDLLLGELSQRVPYYKDAHDFAKRIRSLPRGLRAMAATHQLDVSMALDDLGWHFGNWPSKALSRLTIWGLKELEAVEEAEIFERAFSIAIRFWGFIKSPNFFRRYDGSELEKLLAPLNDRMWELMGYRGEGGTPLFSRWIAYARKYPERVLE